MVSTNKRRDKDVMKLLVSDFDVNLVNENNMSEFIVKFTGPSDSPYEGVSTWPNYIKPRLKMSLTTKWILNYFSMGKLSEG